jgi:photosystem II stability/assembly factor-like uncharacterized protein
MKTKFALSSVLFDVHPLIRRLIAPFAGVLLMVFSSPSSPAQNLWHWQNPAPTANPLSSVYFVNQNTGWTVGAYGELYKTTDGGSSWKFKRIGASDGIYWEPSLYSVYFIDQNTGWLGGGGAGLAPTDTILKTTDAGETWYLKEAQRRLP